MAGGHASSSPSVWIRDLCLGRVLIPLTRQGFSPASFFTVLVNVWEALFDILPHEVGEMAGRPEGATPSHHSRIRAALCELARAPCSSQAPRVPPAVPSGGQEDPPRSLYKPLIEAEGREGTRAPINSGMRDWQARSDPLVFEVPWQVAPSASRPLGRPAIGRGPLETVGRSL